MELDGAYRDGDKGREGGVEKEKLGHEEAGKREGDNKLIDGQNVKGMQMSDALEFMWTVELATHMPNVSTGSLRELVVNLPQLEGLDLNVNIAVHYLQSFVDSHQVCEPCIPLVKILLQFLVDLGQYPGEIQMREILQGLQPRVNTEAVIRHLRGEGRSSTGGSAGQGYEPNWKAYSESLSNFEASAGHAHERLISELRNVLELKGNRESLDQFLRKHPLAPLLEDLQTLIDCVQRQLPVPFIQQLAEDVRSGRFQPHDKTLQKNWFKPKGGTSLNGHIPDGSIPLRRKEITEAEADAETQIDEERERARDAQGDGMANFETRGGSRKRERPFHGIVASDTERANMVTGAEGSNVRAMLVQRKTGIEADKGDRGGHTTLKNAPGTSDVTAKPGVTREEKGREKDKEMGVAYEINEIGNTILPKDFSEKLSTLSGSSGPVGLNWQDSVVVEKLDATGITIAISPSKAEARGREGWEKARTRVRVGVEITEDVRENKERSETLYKVPVPAESEGTQRQGDAIDRNLRLRGKDLSNLLGQERASKTQYSMGLRSRDPDMCLTEPDSSDDFGEDSSEGKISKRRRRSVGGSQEQQQEGMGTKGKEDGGATCESVLKREGPPRKAVTVNVDANQSSPSKHVSFKPRVEIIPCDEDGWVAKGNLNEEEEEEREEMGNLRPTKPAIRSSKPAESKAREGEAIAFPEENSSNVLGNHAKRGNVVQSRCESQFPSKENLFPQSDVASEAQGQAKVVKEKGSNDGELPYVTEASQVRNVNTHGNLHATGQHSEGIGRQNVAEGSNAGGEEGGGLKERGAQQHKGQDMREGATRDNASQREEIAEPIGGKENRSRQRRQTTPWTVSEETFLHTAVKEHNAKWERIRAAGRGIINPSRTSVDIKDKWRNMAKKGHSTASPCPGCIPKVK